MGEGRGEKKSFWCFWDQRRNSWNVMVGNLWGRRLLNHPWLLWLLYQQGDSDIVWTRHWISPTEVVWWFLSVFPEAQGLLGEIRSRGDAPTSNRIRRGSPAMGAPCLASSAPHTILIPFSPLSLLTFPRPHNTTLENPTLPPQHQNYFLGRCLVFVSLHITTEKAAKAWCSQILGEGFKLKFKFKN